MEKKHFPVILEQDEDGVFIMECPLYPGCRSYGDTLEEAIENIQEAIQVCIDDSSIIEKNTVFLGIRDIEIAV